jgi:hypothetical protein
VKSYTHAPVKNRTAILAPDSPGDPQQKWAQKHQAHCRAKGVKNPFHHSPLFFPTSTALDAHLINLIDSLGI